MKQVPILFLSDSPDLRSGLARIGRDLATHVASLPEFRVGYMGRGGHGTRQTPFMTYCFPASDQWGEGHIEAVWEDFAGTQEGIIFTIQDASRMNWFAQPRPELGEGLYRFLTSGRFRRWAYVPVDATGPNDRLTGMSRDTLLGYDRVLAYTKWGAGVIERTIGREVPWIPHGINLKVWQPRDKKAARMAMGFKDSDVVVGCVATTSNVLMEGFSEKPLQDIRTGDRVITSASICRVKALSTPYESKVLRLKAQGIYDDLVLTDDHLVLSVQRSTVSCVFPSWSLSRQYACRPTPRHSEPCGSCGHKLLEWLPHFSPASELKVGDFLAFPIPTSERELIDRSKTQWITSDVYSRPKARRLPETLPWDNKDFLFCLGLWAAEGSIVRHRGKAVGICYSLHRRETELIERIRQGMRSIWHAIRVHFPRNRPNSTEIHVSGHELAEFMIVMWGTGAKRKRWHEDLLAIRPPDQMEIFKGYFAGDGHTYKREVGRGAIVSASKDLIRGAWLVLLRNGIAANMRRDKECRYSLYFAIPGRAVAKDSRRTFIHNRVFYMPIKSITEGYASVMDIEVENDHNFIVSGGVCVHNCVMTNQARKDWGIFAESAALLRKQIKNLKLWAHIDILERHWSLPALIEDFGLSDIIRVTLTGSLNDEGLSYWYSGCDVTMLPSSEGFGYPIVESLACGTPCLHTAHGGGAELIPESLHVRPIYTRLDTLHNCVRPVHNPVEWMECLLNTRTDPPVTKWMQEMVDHLDWTKLWPSCWKKWFLEGLC